MGYQVAYSAIHICTVTGIDTQADRQTCVVLGLGVKPGNRDYYSVECGFCYSGIDRQTQ